MISHHIAVDIGGTQLRAAVIPTGVNTPSRVVKIPTQQRGETPLDRLLGLIAAVWPSDDVVAGIGAAIPGASTELSAGSLTVKIPTGTFTAPPAGAANFSVPGTIISFRGPDGLWRGHGYLESYPRLLKFEGTADKTSASLTYSFEQGKSYKVNLTARDGIIVLDETSDLGPRNVFVFDCYYDHWLPASGFVLDRDINHHAFHYLPCYYDKPEATINPASSKAGAVAVLSDEPAKTDVAGFVAHC